MRGLVLDVATNPANIITHGGGRDRSWIADDRLIRRANPATDSASRRRQIGGVSKIPMVVLINGHHFSREVLAAAVQKKKRSGCRHRPHLVWQGIASIAKSSCRTAATWLSSAQMSAPADTCCTITASFPTVCTTSRRTILNRTSRHRTATWLLTETMEDLAKPVRRAGIEMHRSRPRRKCTRVLAVLTRGRGVPSPITSSASKIARRNTLMPVVEENRGGPPCISGV